MYPDSCAQNKNQHVATRTQGEKCFMVPDVLNTEMQSQVFVAKVEKDAEGKGMS